MIKCIIKTSTAFLFEVYYKVSKFFLYYMKCRIGKSKEMETCYTSDFYMTEESAG